MTSNIPTNDDAEGSRLAAAPLCDQFENSTDLRPFFLTLRDIPPAPLRPTDIFATDQPLEVEIGSGRGLFLVNAGLTCPGTNFLGVEYDYKEARRAARRLQKRNFPHVRLLGADARIVMRDYLPTASARALHVYFPDPWWKRRHKKRRIFSADFLVQAARILEPGGLLHAWTDVEEYFGVMNLLVAENPAFEPLPPPTERAALNDMDYHTSFERKKRKLGLPIFRARWQRR
ncbi:MAG TPA: tRNA (guanosine(46)-N7)-methyltransferase TrmB [Planctomycetaceae bacterium]|jgi:tRNA (guanine-N7-)-methyltransferase